MGNKFSLIQQLDTKFSSVGDQKPDLPEGIKYQEYTIECEGKDINVLIPLRECEAFETTLEKQYKYLDRESLRLLLRNHRGLRA